MNHEGVSKLVSLRRKTDAELLALVERELARGLAFAGAAASRESPLLGQAEKIHQEIPTLLPMISGLSDDDQQRIEDKVEEMRLAMDSVPAKKHTACLSVYGD